MVRPKFWSIGLSETFPSDRYAMDAARALESSSATPRQSTGVPGLDALLGGGLLPGTLTVIVGATGMGKTQLGLQYAHAGRQQEGRRGILFDCTSRGDSQSHAAYARRMFGWELAAGQAEGAWDADQFFPQVRHDPDGCLGDYLHVFDYQGRRVTRRDLDWEAWHDWQALLNARLRRAIAFLYGNFVAGTRRVVVDGIEPVDRPGESIQMQLFEYLYHQVLRKDPAWVARDLFREAYRRHADEVAAQLYDPASVGCLLLVTSHVSLLDELIARPLDEGDVLANANTLIYLGRVREKDRLARGLYIAKHRGSACAERIVTYRISDQGLVIDEA
jgi:KaiC/GvpD/RAD55 family RecA-like ATPase